MLRSVDEPVALSQVVVLGRLVIHIRNDAIALGAKCIVFWLVRKAARREQADALPRPVGAAHVVQRPIILAEERACGGVSSDARVAGLFKDVTWPL
eukprot:COSAG02_NODE_2881_length_7824_cov_3.474822_5_plen_96_part_00